MELPPSHYDVRLDINMKEFSTDGVVDIKFHVVKPTNQIDLYTNYEHLEILAVNITQGYLQDKVVPVQNSLMYQYPICA